VGSPRANRTGACPNSAPIFWSLLFGYLAAVGVRPGIEAITSIWEEVEILRGNDRYADRRTESELLREERLRNECHRDERQLSL
jgi:hypothetical protein